MYLLRRIAYYLVSLWTLTRGIRDRGALFGLLRSHSGPVILTLKDGTRFAVRSLMDIWIIKETNLDRDYERHGTPIRDGWNVVDIGAGLGDFALFAARKSPHGRVFAYEPASASVALLMRNLELNGIKNVEVFPYAVSAKAGVLELDTSCGVEVQYRTLSDGSSRGAGLPVECVSLADAVAGLPGGVCDFLKMDCEGAEYEILLGLDDATLGKIKRICLEYHLCVTPYSCSDLICFFENKGWHIRQHPSRVRRELGLLYAEAGDEFSGSSSWRSDGVSEIQELADFGDGIGPEL